jgi:hypothetical protein
MIKKKFKLNILFAFIIFLYLAWLFKTYAGNIHSVYIDMYQFGPVHLYINDYFLNKSVQHEASILYKFFKFFPITPDNDYFGMFFHFIFSTVAGFCLYLILLKHTEISDKKFILIFLFSILLIGTLFNPTTGNTVTWVSGNTTSPTYFVHGLSFVLFWFTLEKKPIALSIISSLMILIGFKASWFIIGCSSLYSLMYFNNSKEKMWIIAPIICTLYLYLSQFPVPPNSFEDRLFIFEDIVKNDRAETSFFILNNFYIFKIIISFFIFFYIWNQSINNNLKKFSLIVLIVSIVTFLFGYIYFGYGYKFIPLPQLALVSLTRGFGFYELIFWIYIGIYIFKLNIKNIFKTTFLVSIFYVLASFKGLIIGVLINMLTYLSQIIYNKIKRKSLNINIFNKSSKFNNIFVFLFFLALSPGIIYLTYQKFDKGFSLHALQKINKGTTGDLLDNQRIDTAVLLRECNDFILMDPIYHRLTSSIARKSNFIGKSDYNNFDINLINEAKKRRKISNKLENSILNFSEVNKDLLNEIKFYKPIIIIKQNFLKHFPESVNNNMIETGEVLINFYEEEENKKFLINCINKIS